MINRMELKLKAQTIIRDAQDPKPLNVAMVYVAVTVLLGMLSMRLMGFSLTQTDLDQIMKHIENGQAEYAVSYIQRYTPSGLAYLIDSALQIVGQIIAAGFVIFIFNTIRCTAPCYENLLDGFNYWWKLIVLNFLTGLFVALWSMLLVVPGLIAAYSYRQSVYILIDNPEMSPMACIRESKRLMRGRKWELFMLDLSFLGWQLLSSLAIIGWAVSIWTTPYMGFTYVLYYEQLKAIAGGQARDPGFYAHPGDGF